MAELREVTRESFYVPPTDWSGGTGGVLNVGQLQVPSSAQGTLLRSLSFPSVRVSATDPSVSGPPDQWWLAATLHWVMWVSDSSTTSPPGYLDEPSVLLMGKLQPTMVASTVLSDTYYVKWEGPPDGFESKAQRKSANPGTIFYNSGLRWEDPLEGLNESLYVGVNVYTRSLDVAIWGLPG